MRFPYLALIFSLFSIVAFGQHQELAGRVIHSTTSEVVPFAHIYNLSLKTGASAGETGRFKIMVRVNDSIRISSIGFKTQFYKIQPEDLSSGLEFKLKEEALELAPVDIMAFKDIESLKRAIIESDAKVPEKLKVFGLPPPGSDYGKLTVRPRVKAPTAEKLIPAVQMTFVSVPLIMKDKERIIYDRKQTVATKYNPDWIQEVTDLEEDEINEFIRFCRLEEDFIYEASEYDLTVAVLACLDEFKIEHD